MNLIPLMLFLSCCFGIIPVLAQEVGSASYYSDMFHGRKTAFGEIYNKNELTAAHRTLPYNSIVRVTRIDNGRHIDVRINDKGPYIKDRIIDLSKEAAFRLGMLEEGETDVSLEVLKRGANYSKDRYYENYSVLEDDRKTNVPKSIPKVSKPVLTSKGTKKVEKKGPPPPPAWAYKRLYQIEIDKPQKGDYALQVGSFESYENAIQRIAQFHELDYNDILLYFDKRYFKVFLGPFLEKDDALSMKNELKKKANIPSFLISLENLTNIKP